MQIKAYWEVSREIPLKGSQFFIYLSRLRILNNLLNMLYTQSIYRFLQRGHIMARLFSICLIFLISMLTVAQAQITKRFCVNCKSPDKTYLCSIKSEGLANNTALGLHCVVKLSTTRKHQSCTVSKTEPDICEGRKVSFDYKDNQEKSTAGNSRILPGGKQQESDSEPVTRSKASEKQQHRKAQARQQARQRKKEPKTLIELTDKVADDTGKALKKTGKAISKATKKTFKCIGSLFSKC